MYMSVLFAAVLLSVQLVAGYNHELEPVMPFQHNMAQLLMTSPLTAEDPVKAMKCFSDYISRSNENSQKYSNDYKQCLVQSKLDRSALDGQMLLNKDVMVQTTAEVCSRMNECNEMNSTMETFKCHAQYGAENSRDVYIVAGNASEYITVMQEHYRIIDLHHEQCCKMSERTYVNLSAENYRKLHDCLECKGNGVLTPSTADATEDNGTTTTTTVIVQQTTDTEEPVSPEDLTAAVVAAATTTTTNEAEHSVEIEQSGEAEHSVEIEQSAEEEHSVEIEDRAARKLVVGNKPTEGLAGLLNLLN